MVTIADQFSVAGFTIDTDRTYPVPYIKIGTVNNSTGAAVAETELTAVDLPAHRWRGYNAVVIELGGGTGAAGDTLDVNIQMRMTTTDGDGAWRDVVAFDQISGALANGFTYGECVVVAASEVLDADGVIAVGTAPDIFWGSQARVQYTIGDGGADTSATYNFGVYILPFGR